MSSYIGYGSYRSNSGLGLLEIMMALILISCAFPIFSENSNKNVRFRNLFKISLQGYDIAKCIKYSPTEQICTCRDPQVTACNFVFIQDGHKVYEWPTYCYMAGTEGFEILKLDLDHDGSDEIITANYDGMSNGIGIVSWTISIFKVPIGKTQPVSFGAEDYGYSCFHEKQGGGFSILATEWIMQSEAPGIKGNYFIGRWFTYKDGALEQDTSQLILKRRNTFSFEKLRGRSFEERYPYNFPAFELLSSKDATPDSKEPFYLKTKLPKIKEGMITEAEKVIHGDSIDLFLTMEFMQKNKVRMKYGQYYSTNTFKTMENCFDRFGDISSGRLYPLRYMPSNPSTSLKGKSFRLITYDDLNIPGRFPMQIVWLKE